MKLMKKISIAIGLFILSLWISAAIDAAAGPDSWVRAPAFFTEMVLFFSTTLFCIGSFINSDFDD